ncbi:ABC transporter permease [Streptacidiphilus cavernicola]|uniref:ABC transporter permease n=1 Tax=Streptacidiphilus cavernicola TaxID=3342716 RepID=A0ABV6VT73_9ACTN
MAGLISRPDAEDAPPRSRLRSGRPRSGRPHAGRPRSDRPRFGRAAILLLCGVYFVVPVLASFLFTVDDPVHGFTLHAYSQIFKVDGLWPALQLSLELAVATIAVVYLLLVPAVVAVRLGSQRLRTVVELACTLPLVVPAIAFTAGITSVLSWGSNHLAVGSTLFQLLVDIQNPSFPVILLLAYVVMALPLAYRTLDAGMRALDVRTLLEAAQNNGAGRTRAIITVILPNLRGALLNTAFLTLALVLGEFTVSSILGFQPFSVWIVNGNAAGQGDVTVAVSIVSLVLTWLLLLVLSAGGNRRRKASTPTTA